MVELCDSLRAERKERWHKLGGTVGLSEWDIKGGVPQPKVQRPVTNGTVEHVDNLAPDTKSSAVNGLPESKSDTVLV